MFSLRVTLSDSDFASMRFLTGNATGTDGGSMILTSTGNLTLKDLRTAETITNNDISNW